MSHGELEHVPVLKVRHLFVWIFMLVVHQAVPKVGARDETVRRVQGQLRLEGERPVRPLQVRRTLVDQEYGYGARSSRQASCARHVPRYLPDRHGQAEPVAVWDPHGLCLSTAFR